MDLRQRLQALQYAGPPSRISPPGIGNVSPFNQTLFNMISSSSCVFQQSNQATRLEERIRDLEDYIVQQEYEKQEMLKEFQNRLQEQTMVRPRPQHQPALQQQEAKPQHLLLQQDAHQEETDPVELPSTRPRKRAGDDYDMDRILKVARSFEQVQQIRSQEVIEAQGETRPRGQNPGFVGPNGKINDDSKWDGHYKYVVNNKPGVGAFIVETQVSVGAKKQKIFRPKHSNKWFYDGTSHQTPSYSKSKPKKNETLLELDDVEWANLDSLETLDISLVEPKTTPIVKYKIKYTDKKGYSEEYPYTCTLVFKATWDPNYTLTDISNLEAPHVKGAWIAKIDLTVSLDDTPKRPFLVYGFKPWRSDDKGDFSFESRGDYKWVHMSNTTIKYHGVRGAENDEFFPVYFDD